jgi:hypothetical protein
MRRDRDREVEERAQSIVKNGKVAVLNTKCPRCDEYVDRIGRLETEVKRISILVVTITDEKSHLNEELLRATEDISILETKKTDL